MNITCDDPLHPTRKNEPGWAAVLGTSDRPTHGYLCGACAAHVSEPAPAPSEAERLAALEDLLANASSFADLKTKASKLKKP